MIAIKILFPTNPFEIFEPVILVGDFVPKGRISDKVAEVLQRIISPLKHARCLNKIYVYIY